MSKKYRVTFTIDVFAGNKEESFIGATWQLEHRDYDMDDINMQSTECIDEKEYE